MKNFFLSSAFAAPLLLAVAVLIAGNAEANYRLPGRSVNSTEASAIMGGACNKDSEDCSPDCSGNKAYGVDGSSGSNSGGGCDANCSTSSVSATKCNAG